jgi:hypothetical protein
MTTRTIIILAIGLLAIVALAIWADPSAREWAIAAIATVSALLIRAGDHARRNPGGGPGSGPAAGLILAIVVTGCSSAPTVDAGAPIWEGADLEIHADETSVELEAEAGARYRMIQGRIQMDGYYSDDRAVMTALMSLSILDQIGAALLVTCDLYGETCELCLLSGKDQLWCHEWTGEADGAK